MHPDVLLSTLLVNQWSGIIGNKITSKPTVTLKWRRVIIQSRFGFEPICFAVNIVVVGEEVARERLVNEALVVQR